MVNLQPRYLEQGCRLRIFLFLPIPLPLWYTLVSIYSRFFSTLSYPSIPFPLSKFEPMCKTIDSIGGGLVLTSFLSPRFIVNRSRFRGETPLLSLFPETEYAGEISTEDLN